MVQKILISSILLIASTSWAKTEMSLTVDFKGKVNSFKLLKQKKSFILVRQSPQGKKTVKLDKKDYKFIIKQSRGIASTKPLKPCDIGSIKYVSKKKKSEVCIRNRSKQAQEISKLSNLLLLASKKAK